MSKLIIRKMSNFYVSPKALRTVAARQERKKASFEILAEFVRRALREHSRNIGESIGEASEPEDEDFLIF